jgi:GDPmannose 4,6-dehydratase
VKRSVIVGCNGQDGRILHQFLLEKKYELIGISKNTVSYHACIGGMDKIDITNTDDVYKLVDSFKPDEIYHLAAVHSSSEFEDIPIDNIELYQNSHSVNVFSLVNFLEGIRKYSPQTKLFYAASSHIFGNQAGDLQDESTPINPNSIYGITKAAGLFACRFYRNNYCIFASTGILYNHESSFRQQGFISKKIIRGAVEIKKGRKAKLVLGDLDAEIDWGYAPDYVDAMYKILDSPAADDFIVATGEKHTVRDFAEVAFGYLGLDWKSYVERDRRLISKNRICLVGNPAKLMSVTGWRPSVDFNQMIRILVDEELKLSDP